LPDERLRSATFPLPTAEDVADAAGAHQLRQARRLTLREGATPSRWLGRISIRPRVYQFVPLMMALRLDPVRVLIAADAGLGTTTEVGMSSCRVTLSRMLVSLGGVSFFHHSQENVSPDTVFPVTSDHDSAGQS
jgi:hypothetical protein